MKNSANEIKKSSSRSSQVDMICRHFQTIELPYSKLRNDANHNHKLSNTS